MNERRKHPRIRVQHSIDVFDLEREQKIGRLVDLSITGLMLLSHGLVEVNRVFHLQLLLPPELEIPQIRFGAESLWREAGFDAGSCWAGFHIIDLSVENAALLQQLIHKGG
jgi:hypothetical protein